MRSTVQRVNILNAVCDITNQDRDDVVNNLLDGYIIRMVNESDEVSHLSEEICLALGVSV